MVPGTGDQHPLGPVSVRDIGARQVGPQLRQICCLQRTLAHLPFGKQRRPFSR